jgi:hypothetical protein
VAPSPRGILTSRLCSKLYRAWVQSEGSSGEERAEHTEVRERAPQPEAEPGEMRRQQPSAV